MAEVEQPVDPHVQRVLYAVGKAIDDFVKEHYPNEKMGFFVSMFDFGDKGRFNYMSNGNRQDIIKLMEEMLIKFKGS